MNISDLYFLRCPYCYGALRLKHCTDRIGNRVRQGVVFCDCDEYPIFESILILKKIENRMVLKDLSTGYNQHAFNRLIDVHRGYDRLLKLVGPGATITKAYRRILSRSLLRDIGYRNIVLPLLLFPSERLLATYLLWYPGSIETRVPAVLLSSLPAKPKTIVDVGCGVTSYTTHLNNATFSTLISIDNNFATLYLSTIFFNNPRQSLVYADLTDGFPIKSNSVDLIFSLNCFEDLYNQQRTWSSMLSSAKKGGVVFLGDLHPPGTSSPPTEFWYIKAPSFYTRNISKPYIIIDYDTLLQKIAKNKKVIFNRIRYRQEKGKRYGIIVGDSV